MPDIQPTDPRVVLALERTLLAWTRTALALMGFGFVVARMSLLIRELGADAAVMNAAGSRWVGIVLIGLGGLVQTVALVAHARNVERLRTGQMLALRAMTPATVLGIVIILLGVVVAVYLATSVQAAA